MKRLLVVILICIGFSASSQEVYTSSGKPANARKRQQEEKGFDASKLIFGGGLALGFGTVTNLGISPVVGYRITDNFAAGISLGYQYNRIKNFWSIQDPVTGAYKNIHYKASILSGGVWTRYVVWQNIFAHAEYEHNLLTYNEPAYDQNGSGNIVEKKTKLDAPALLLGGGFRQPMTENSSFVISALYDVLQHEYSPYGNQLFFRFGFNVGF